MGASSASTTGVSSLLISYMRWDPKPVIRRVLRWVKAVRKGKPDREIINFPAEFVPGGSIGPVWKG